MSFEDRAVIVSGVTPGGRVALFSVALETERYVARIFRRDHLLEDEGRAGRVTLEVPRPVPIQSVWAAVDLDSLGFAVGAPEGFSLREIEPVIVTSPSALDRVDLHDFLMAEVLLIRGGVGAWALGVGDGGASDVAGPQGDADGVIGVAPAAMWPIGDSPPAPRALASGDLLLVIDPQELSFTISSLTTQGWERP